MKMKYLSGDASLGEVFLLLCRVAARPVYKEKNLSPDKRGKNIRIKKD
jgi:hypothetical protein